MLGSRKSCTDRETGALLVLSGQENNAKDSSNSDKGDVGKNSGTNQDNNAGSSSYLFGGIKRVAQRLLEANAQAFWGEFAHNAEELSDVSEAIPINGPEELAGAAAVDSSPAIGAIIVGANAVVTKGKSLVNDICRPTLVTNPKHVPGGAGFRKDAGIQPDDFQEVYNNSIEYKGSYWGKSTDGKSIYRYSGSGDSRHWTGSTGGKANPLTRSRVPDRVLKELGFSAKGKNSPWK
ncbi:hypothetical protein [Alteromonas confluentis]|uniref:Uncharacterized protein n=1 Tax=Alteromonas confluentis TaxID=1656094 RepID=A0A1E7ZGQ9_9ALTE|nr:hypothetical protein [Alteromonas confluentis]OFC72691.1 hypothetical protein BFC18_02245 [Alteromonas confluentis]